MNRFVPIFICCAKNASHHHVCLIVCYKLFLLSCFSFVYFGCFGVFLYYLLAKRPQKEATRYLAQEGGSKQRRSDQTKGNAIQVISKNRKPRQPKLNTPLNGILSSTWVPATSSKCHWQFGSFPSGIIYLSLCFSHAKPSHKYEISQEAR